MKRPFETIRENIFSNLDRQRENQKYNFDNSEKFMLWIVGFSVGGISLIAGNVASLNQVYNHGTLKTVLVLLSISIISGIVYRWAFYLYQIQYQIIEFFLQGAFSNIQVMETDPNAISNETNVYVVIRRLNSDFGEDVSNTVEKYLTVDETLKNMVLEDLKNHYKMLAEWAKRDYDFGIQYTKEIFHEAFGYSHGKIDKIFESKPSKKFKIFGWVTVIAFFITCLTFISVLIVLLVLY